MDCALPELLEVIKRVDVITINDEEARQLSGEYSWLKRRPKSKLWGQNVVIKKGNTVLYCFMIFRFSCTSFAIGRGFDPTGAGDTLVVLQDLLHKVKTYHSKT
jgi:sugar/nucleoside kinase (ribokinase family)